MRSANRGAEFEWEVVPNPARRVMFWLAVVFGILFIASVATSLDGFLDYADRSGRCGSVGIFDDDVSSRCSDALGDVTRGVFVMLAAVPCLFMGGLFWALHATRDPYRQRLAEPDD